MVGNEKVEYTKEGLKSLIAGYDAISFDIFDTLVMRKVYFNHDVFRIVGEKYAEILPDFFDYRVRAERELSRTRYPYMEEIYEHIAKESGVSLSVAMEMMQYEMSVEKSVIVPRKDMVDIFNYCKEIGKFDNVIKLLNEVEYPKELIVNCNEWMIRRYL